jgi:hypothetical protein
MMHLSAGVGNGRLSGAMQGTQNVKAGTRMAIYTVASFRVLTFSLHFPRRHWSIL